MKNATLSGKIKLRLIDLLRGTRIVKVLGELRIQQYLPAAELDALRQKKLDRLFGLAKNSTPYYRQFSSFSQLPVLTKDMVRQRPADFMNAAFKKKLMKKTTGGSTGAPFTYYNTSTSQSYIWAGLLLSWEATGYRAGQRVAFVAGSSIIKRGWQYRLFYYLLNVDLLPASPLNDEVMAAYVQQLQQNRNTVIYGYAHTINSIADYIIRRGGAAFPHLMGVVTTAEILTPSARANIQKAFGVKVHDQYGCNEGGISAFECEKGNMHLISNRCVYETLEDGTLAATDLVNEGFIMMKYCTNDLVTFGGGTCACKRGFPIIQSVTGRQNDVVVDMDNNVLHASFFGIVIGRDTSIKQYQLTFTNETIELNIHSNTGNMTDFKQRYLPMLRQHAAFTHYSVKMNSPFVLYSNGKHKEVVDQRGS